MENGIKYASIGKRSFAFLIDDLVVSILFIIIFYNQIITLTTPEMMLAFITANTWVLFALKVVYHTFFIGYNGATVGKAIIGIKAVNEDNPNENLPWAMAFIRAVVREIGEMLFYITFLFAFGSPKKQTLHDKISKCIVIDAK